MRNPFCAYASWWRGKVERAEARGGWHLFWFCMTAGLYWSLLTAAITGVFGLFNRDAYKYLSLQERLSTYFVGGLLFGLIMWLLRLSRRAGRPAAPR